MGFSVVSLIEIIYFVSLRPYYKHLRHLRKIRKEKINKATPKKPTALYSNRDCGIFQRRQLITHFKPIVLDEKKNDRVFYPSLKYWLIRTDAPHIETIRQIDSTFLSCSHTYFLFHSNALQLIEFDAFKRDYTIWRSWFSR